MKVSFLPSIIVLACTVAVLATPAPAPAPESSIIASKLEAIAATTETRDLQKRSVKGTVTASALKYRTCPKTSCTAVGQYGEGAIITISCRTETGTTVVEGWPWWDKLSNGYYVSDYYVEWTGGVPPVC